MFNLLSSVLVRGSWSVGAALVLVLERCWCWRGVGTTATVHIRSISESEINIKNSSRIVLAMRTRTA
jgi:hypothetical protein